MNKIYFKFLFLILSLSFSAINIHAQCDPDETPPTAVCNGFINVSLGADGTATITTDIINEHSWDMCDDTDVILAISILTIGATIPPVPPTTTEITFNCCHIGNHFINLWVTDQSGNTNSCWAEIQIEDKIDACIDTPFDCTPKNVKGIVYHDLNQNCENNSEMPVAHENILLRSISDGLVYDFGKTDGNGNFEFEIPFYAGGEYELTLPDYPENAFSCGNLTAFSIDSAFTEITVDVPYEDFTNNSQKVFFEGVSATVSPNPMSDFSVFKIDGKDFKTGKLTLFNNFGQMVSEVYFIGNEIQIRRNGLPSGVFYYQITDGEKLAVTGKLVMN